MTLALLNFECKNSTERAQKLYFAGKWGKNPTLIAPLQECRAAAMNEPCQCKRPYPLEKNEFHFLESNLC